MQNKIATLLFREHRPVSPVQRASQGAFRGNDVDANSHIYRTLPSRR